MTLSTLMSRAAEECVDEREQYLIIFTHGSNGYVCRNEGVTGVSKALYHGSYRDCQVWVERRGIAAALREILDHLSEVPELADASLTPAELLGHLSAVAA
jgi:hypothetical protein